MLEGNHYSMLIQQLQAKGTWIDVCVYIYIYMCVCILFEQLFFIKV